MFACDGDVIQERALSVLSYIFLLVSKTADALFFFLTGSASGVHGGGSPRNAGDRVPSNCKYAGWHVLGQHEEGGLRRGGGRRRHQR